VAISTTLDENPTDVRLVSELEIHGGRGVGASTSSAPAALWALLEVLATVRRYAARNLPSSAWRRTSVAHVGIHVRAGDVMRCDKRTLFRIGPTSSERCLGSLTTGASCRDIQYLYSSWWLATIWPGSSHRQASTFRPFLTRKLYILCWSEFSRRRLLPAVSPAAGHLTTPTEAGLPGLCENFRPATSKSSPILRLLSSHWATNVVRTRVVGVANVGNSLRRLSSLQHRIYNLLGF